MIRRTTARDLAIVVPATFALIACTDRAHDQATPTDPARAEQATPSAPPTEAPRHWQCSETGVASRSAGPGTVHLFVSGRFLALRVDPAAGGTRVAADARGNRFEMDGDTARLTLSGEPPADCTQAPRASPWFEAAERGVVLRAVGNEPGWLAEIRSGQRPVLHATLDYGERVIELPLGAGPGTGSRAWTATADGDETVTLVTVPAACRDGMSGVLHEVRVDLKVGDRTYAGCGAFLDDFAAFID